MVPVQGVTPLGLAVMAAMGFNSLAFRHLKENTDYNIGRRSDTMAKARSPNAPNIPLEDAVALAERLRDAEPHTRLVPVHLIMGHWGYTPKSLSDVLKEAGLGRVSQEPAQFKQREPRDMRMVGYKK